MTRCKARSDGRRYVGGYGDCAVYALAATRALPLLCNGTDFDATDLTLYRAGR